MSKHLFLSISKEEPEAIAKITRRVVDINKLTYSFSIFIFIDKEYIFNHSRFYIFNEYNFFFKKKKLNKVMKENIKKYDLKLKMKSFIYNHLFLYS